MVVILCIDIYIFYFPSVIVHHRNVENCISNNEVMYINTQYCAKVNKQSPVKGNNDTLMTFNAEAVKTVN